MIPHDLPASVLELPAGDRRSAVLFSGDDLRHRRLGYAIQARFPGLLQRWFAFAASESGVASGRLGTGPVSSQLARAGGLLRTTGFRATARRAFARASSRDRSPRPSAADRNAAERAMFGREVERLRSSASIEPTLVPDPNAAEVLQSVHARSPYLLLCCGGPLLSRELIGAPRGLAINQHAGHAPEYRGSRTVPAALYHRDLAHLGATVHLMTTAADAGAILRRATTTLHPMDPPEAAFLATVALGSELLLDVVEEILDPSTAVMAVFPQPAGGRTWRATDLTPAMRAAIERDAAADWLGQALADRVRW